MDPGLFASRFKRIDALLALMAARSTKTPSSLAGIAVINTGQVPTAGPANGFQFVLGGEGMPSPATFTSATGKVRVTVLATVRCTLAQDLTQFFPVRDGVNILAPFGLQSIAVADSNGGNVSNVVLVFYDDVTPGVPHSWGASIQSLNPGGGSPCTINVAKGEIIVEDR